MLVASARRSGFDALATSIARLPQAGRTVALPALARALPASGRDVGKFHTLQTQTQTLDANAQGRALPGLIRHIGVLPQQRRKVAFDAIVLQVQTLPPLQQRNLLRAWPEKSASYPPTSKRKRPLACNNWQKRYCALREKHPQSEGAHPTL
jgi:hypothetical protein